MDIRKKTCLIIKKNGEYLAGRIIFSTDLRWSIYRHEAVRTRNIDKAKDIARKTGGILMLFNPITGDERIYQGR